MSKETAIQAVKWGPAEAHCIPADIIILVRNQARAPDDQHDSKLAYLKLFTPDGAATWYISEWHDEGEGEILLFGLCDLGMGFPELGYVSLRELMQVRGALGLPVERDMYWEPVLLSEVVSNHGG